MIFEDGFVYSVLIISAPSCLNLKYYLCGMCNIQVVATLFYNVVSELELIKTNMKMCRNLESTKFSAKCGEAPSVLQGWNNKQKVNFTGA